MWILGISCMYHDSAAALVHDSEIIAAAQEERFTRIKHDNSLPVNAIDFCLKEAGISILDVDEVVYYDMPLLTLDRFLNNVRALGDDAEYLVENSFDDLVVNRLNIDQIFRHRYGLIGKRDTLLVCEHHLSHAASAFYPSPFENSAIVTIDGVGEWATTTIGFGDKNKIEILKEIDYPHSLGLMYSTFTSFCGFRVNSGDYKFMGLAPYGEPVYYDVIRDNIIDVKEDGSYRLNLEYFDFYRGKYMFNKKFESLFGGEKRNPESRITRREMDIAASVQKITEEIVIAIATQAKKLTNAKNIVLAGGVALNCVANGKLAEAGLFENIWIQPAAGDAGGALGCALYALYNKYDFERVTTDNDTQKGSYLGPCYSNSEVEIFLQKHNCCYVKYDDAQNLFKDIAGQLNQNKVVGWFRGKMEYGPRALGNRSILASPMSEETQSVLNLKIKFRESFRPFAPSVISERVGDYFDLKYDSPYMLLVSKVKNSICYEFDKEKVLEEFQDDMLPVVNMKRSDIPAVTHIDYSARVQSVDQERNPDYYSLIKEFEKLSGCGVLVNTSFNVRGEPIVCSLLDAYICFMRTNMDVLVLEDYVLFKDNQAPMDKELLEGVKEYELD